MRHEQDESMTVEHAVRMFKKKIEMHREVLQNAIGNESLDSWIKRNERDLRGRLISLSALTYSIERMAEDNQKDHR